MRNLEIIGEAVKHVSAATRSKCPEVPWSAIAGMRDRLIHDYFRVDLNIAWDVVEHDLAPLRKGATGLVGRGVTSAALGLASSNGTEAKQQPNLAVWGDTESGAKGGR